ncbi:MAG: hypothetical protein C0617_12150 [Desulfuromonas sp.]|nr:MAG: hypothetical protein C0617_12150 [Desulfuromonas sp.]
MGRKKMEHNALKPTFEQVLLAWELLEKQGVKATARKILESTGGDMGVLLTHYQKIQEIKAKSAQRKVDFPAWFQEATEALVNRNVEIAVRDIEESLQFQGENFTNVQSALAEAQGEVGALEQELATEREKFEGVRLDLVQQLAATQERLAAAQKALEGKSRKIEALENEVQLSRDAAAQEKIAALSEMVQMLQKQPHLHPHPPSD